MSKNRGMGTTDRGQRTPSVRLQVRGGEGWPDLGKARGDAGKPGEVSETRLCFCGCVISLLQAGSTAAEPDCTSTLGPSSGHQS